MPIVREIYGKQITKSGVLKGKLKNALCPYMSEKKCDGGGNRVMARWPTSEPPLNGFFDLSKLENDEFAPCGICSIQTERNWAVCPRRLLTFDTTKPLKGQALLYQRIFDLAEFRSGTLVEVWSEVAVNFRSAGKKFNYRFDYVLKTQNRSPVIVEVMTGSTSGSNKKIKTDIKSAFCNAVLYAEGRSKLLGQAPNINVRQVWARMVSQMIAKSEIARKWGGSAIWVVQDALLDYLDRNSGLNLVEMRSMAWKLGEVNLISANIDDPTDLKFFTGPIKI